MSYQLFVMEMRHLGISRLCCRLITYSLRKIVRQTLSLSLLALSAFFVTKTRTSKFPDSFSDVINFFPLEKSCGRNFRSVSVRYRLFM